MPSDCLKNPYKELSLCHKLWFSNPHIFTTQCCRPKIFQTVNCVRSNNQSLKFKKFTPTDCKGLENLSLWQRINSFQHLYLKHVNCCNQIQGQRGNLLIFYEWMNFLPRPHVIYHGKYNIKNLVVIILYWEHH